MTYLSYLFVVVIGMLLCAHGSVWCDTIPIYLSPIVSAPVRVCTRHVRERYTALPTKSILSHLGAHTKLLAPCTRTHTHTGIGGCSGGWAGGQVYVVDVDRRILWMPIC